MFCFAPSSLSSSLLSSFFPPFYFYPFLSSLLSFLLLSTPLPSSLFFPLDSSPLFCSSLLFSPPLSLPPSLLQLGKLCFEQGDFARLTRIIRQLRQSCQTEDGVDDVKKGTQLLEVCVCVCVCPRGRVCVRVGVCLCLCVSVYIH